MASELYVETLKGLTSGANANTVTVGSGQTLYAPGHVIQVQSFTLTSTESVSADTSSTSWKDTSLTVDITPTSTTSKIYIACHVMYNYTSAGENVYMRLLRDSTAISVGDTAGSRTSVTIGVSNSSSSRGAATSFMHLDSPSSTNTLTYKIQLTGNNPSGSIYVNRTADNTDAFYRPRGTSSITVMEIAG